MGLGQQLFGNSAGCHAADGFAGRGAATSATGLNAVLGLVGRIGMGRPKGDLHLLVVAGALVLVAHHHGNRGAQGDAIEQATEDLDLVVFLARCRDPALPGFAPVQLMLNRRDIKRQPRRAAIDDHADTATVGFAEGADAKKLAEAAAHGRCALV